LVTTVEPDSSASATASSGADTHERRRVLTWFGRCASTASRAISLCSGWDRKRIAPPLASWCHSGCVLFGGWFGMAFTEQQRRRLANEMVRKGARLPTVAECRESRWADRDAATLEEVARIAASASLPNVSAQRSLITAARNIRLTQIDGKLPNLALMKLAYHHRAMGDVIHFTKQLDRDTFEPRYERVYGSAIFSFSAPKVARFQAAFPDAIVGGTYNILDNRTVEQALGIEDNELYDYSIYPLFDGSIGFTQRGCRLRCGFCVVPRKEGKPHSVNTIASIWRGSPYPKHIHLLDNDFFGQPREQWQARIAEIRAGGFKICFNQGINTRMIDDESAAALASVPYFDDSFRFRRLYTAWDNIGDEERFFRGVDTLERHGIPPHHLMTYMLIGYDRRETWERVLYRFNRMVERGIKPYPMVYGERGRGLSLGGCRQKIQNKTLGDFQRWAIRRLYTLFPFEQYRAAAARESSLQPT
jgi:hypothetical protein